MKESLSGLKLSIAKANIDVETLHANAFYQYQLNDNIAITPEVIYANNLDHNHDNDDLIVGTLLTTL
ncbi:MAG: carbohydrate porin [Pleurocapsa sp.]